METRKDFADRLRVAAHRFVSHVWPSVADAKGWSDLCAGESCGCAQCQLLDAGAGVDGVCRANDGTPVLLTWRVLGTLPEACITMNDAELAGRLAGKRDRAEWVIHSHVGERRLRYAAILSNKQLNKAVRNAVMSPLSRLEDATNRRGEHYWKLWVDDLRAGGCQVTELVGRDVRVFRGDSWLLTA